VLACRLADLRLPVDATPAAHDPLDVLRGASARHGKQALFRLGRGDTRHRPHLGVRDPAALERLRQTGQRPERARHAHPLPSRSEVEPHAPAQPRGARSEPGVPAPAGVELPDAIEQARGRGLEVGGKLGDLIAQAVEFRDAIRSSEDG
jgi:hypothetical protein